MKIIRKKILKKTQKNPLTVKSPQTIPLDVSLSRACLVQKTNGLKKKIDSRMNSKNTGATIFTREMMSSEKIDAELLKSKEK